MKKYLLIAFSLFHLTCFAGLSPSETNVYCPKTTYQFTYTYVGEVINPYLGNKVDIQGSIVGNSYDDITKISTLTINLTFNDVATNHSVTLIFNVPNSTLPFQENIVFPKIKSLYQFTDTLSTNISQFQLDSCSSSTKTIAFLNLKFINKTTSTKFADIVNYLYTLPEKITSMGGKFLWDDCKEVPEVQTSIYHYPKQKKMIQFEVRHWNTNLEDGAGVGNIFYGDKGYMVIKGYGTYETYLGEKREKGPARTESGELGLHFQNWFDAIRARDMSIQNGPVQTGHLSSSLAHLGNISYRLERQLTFDPVAERFIGEGENEANAMLSRDYRAPYLLPEII